MSFRVLTSHTSVGFATLTLAALSFAASAQAAGDPRGIWYDHNGRGAVEIKECASNAKRLCGHVVYVKKARNKKRCGMQIIGNVRSNGRGWIYSPKRGRSFPLSVKRLSDNRLRIVGNAGSFFTKTYTWKRAPDSVVNCGQAVVAKAKVKPVAKPVVAKVQQKVAPQPTKTTATTTKAKTTTQPRVDTGNASSATAALLSTTAVAAAETPVEAPAAPEAPEASAPVSDANVADDLSPPGGLSDGSDGKLGKLKEVLNKFTGGKGLKGFKLKGKGRGKCKYRIPYVGRTIRVPCK